MTAESSSDDDESTFNLMVMAKSSKREYLLAQIRQKDAIIESLLKQVSLPPSSFSIAVIVICILINSLILSSFSSISFSDSTLFSFNSIITPLPSPLSLLVSHHHPPPKLLQIQLHNPYLATPLSIDSYRMATSPSDQNNRNVLQWLERMQESVRTAGVSAGPKAFEFSSRRRFGGYGQQRHQQQEGGGGDDDSDGESDNTSDPTRGPGSTIHGGNIGGGDVGVGGGGMRERSSSRDIEEMRGEDEKLHALPDSAVPLGLIANLSLSSHRRRSGGKMGGGRGGGGEAGDDDKEVDDDDNVVCFLAFGCEGWVDWKMF